MFKILLSKYKWYLIGAGVAAFSVGMVLYTYKVYDYGRNVERVRQAALIEEARSEERAKVEKVIEYRDKIKVVYRDRIKQIQAAQDPTGCADTKLTDMGFELHQSR